METESEFLLTLSIIERMRSIEGWFAEDEADLLIALARAAVLRFPSDHAVVEVGSYCGRSTVALGYVVQVLTPSTRVHAVDPHTGEVGAADQQVSRTPVTLEAFRQNITAAGLDGVVVLHQQYSYEVHWKGPIGLLLIDGLHDFDNVARDFGCFAPWLVEGGVAVFHDYADYYPGVQRFVDELLAGEQYREVTRVRSLIAVEKRVCGREGRDAGR